MKNDIARSITIEQLKQQYRLDTKELQKAIELERSNLNKIENELNNYIDAVTKEIENLQNQVDGNITTWFFSGVPTLENQPANEWLTDEEKNNHLGDLYYDSSTGYAYRFTLTNGVYSWFKLTDSDITEALALANSAKDTADSKRRVFLEQPIPPYDNGDMWIKDGEIWICQISKPLGESYTDSDFINNLNYTDDTKATEVDGKLTVLSGRVTTVETGISEISQKVEENKYFVDSEGNQQLISSAMTQVTQDVNGLEVKIDNIQLKVLYTWIKYADDENGTNMSSSSVDKEYIGIAINKETATASENPEDYTWSLIKGEDGIAGETGKSAYQIWLDAGNTGTEEEYIASLKGEKGETGAQGEQGIRGEIGPSGADGKDAAIQSEVEPEDTNQLWYDIANNQLKRYDGNQWIVINDFSDDIERLEEEFAEHYTKEQIDEMIINSETGLTNTFTKIGGNNLLKNTGLYFKTNDIYDYWAGNVEKKILSESMAGTSMLLKNNTLKQNVSIANGTYSVGFKYRRLNELGNATVKYNGREIVLDDEGVIQTTGEVTTNSFEIEIICDLDDSYEIWELMLNKGSECSVWSQSANEVHTDTVNISKGVTVEATENDTVTHMGADGFNIKNKITNKYVHRATDTGTETPNIKAESGTIGGLMLKKVGNQTIGVGI